ncbi:CIA30 family protein [Modicisalibacter radicis]|uniref:CIA30 family protein n=1 Tax=Halomonas sp. EAR18 TaxID=2518972 RepID=UPI00109CBD2F|nr:CIA30 family protein [Halomonas sp. EAR18]
MPTLIDFSNKQEAARWRPINDAVMGGASNSIMHAESTTGVFSGELSLTNGGGFASVRRDPETWHLSDHAGLCIRARGDGRRYQLRLYTSQLLEGGAYRGVFQPQVGEWQCIALPWSDFEPVFRGRILEEAPPLDPGELQQIGVLIADRKEGPFHLEISSLSTLGTVIGT